MSRGSVEFAPNTMLLDKYRVEQTLGRGGMGVVLRARHTALDELVAIKLLTEVQVNQEVFSRFLREARAAAKLRSAHVVRVNDVGELPTGMPYMVMELLEGSDLNALIKRGGPMDPGLVAALIIQTCEALTEAHAHGIVHRDIKTSNLFVTELDGLPHIKVLDFGIAKAPESVDFSLTRTSSMLGTPGYMSPEQLRSSRQVDQRTDIWSLGVVMYEALEGRRPFDADLFSELCLKIGVDPAPPMTRTHPALAAIVMRCLEKAPEARFQSVGELALALEPFAGDRAGARREIERIERLMRMSGMSLAPRVATMNTVAAMPSSPSANAPSTNPSYGTPPTNPSYGAPSTNPPYATPPTGASQITPGRSRRPLITILVAGALIGAGIATVLVLASSGSSETRPSDTKPGDTKARTTDDKSAGDKAAGTTTGDNAVGDKSAGDKTVDDKAAGDRSVDDKTAGDKTAGDKAAGDKTAGDKTAGDKTAGDKTATDKTAGDKTAGDKTANDKTATDKTATDKTASDKTASDKTATDKTATDNAASNKTAGNKTMDDKTAGKVKKPPVVKKPPRPPAGAGSGSAKKPCDPFTDRQGCL